MRRILILRNPDGADGASAAPASTSTPASTPAPATSSQIPSDDGVTSFADFASKQAPTTPQVVDVSRTRFTPSEEIKFSTEDGDEGDAAVTTVPRQTTTEEVEQKTSDETKVEKPAKSPKIPKFELDAEEAELEKPAKEEQQQKPAKQPTQTQAKDKVARNYEGLPEEVKEILANLHNTPYNKYRDALIKWHTDAQRATELEAKLAKASQPNVQWWYDNPNAYVLTEEYARASQEHETAAFEHRHWQRQLQAIENGDAWAEIVCYDQQGQPQYRQHPARSDGRIDSQAKAFAVSAIAQLGTMQRAAQQQLSQVQNEFKQRVQASSRELQEAEDKIFPSFKDEKAYTPEQKQMCEMVYNLYPPHMRSHPAIRHVAKAYMGFYKVAKMRETELAELKKVKAELESLKAKTNFARAVPSKAPAPGSEDARRMSMSDDIDLAKLNEEMEND